MALTSWNFSNEASCWYGLPDALLSHDENESISFSFNSPSSLVACSMPTVMLFSRAFSSKDSFSLDGFEDLANFPCNHDLFIWLGEMGEVGFGIVAADGVWGRGDVASLL